MSVASGLRVGSGLRPRELEANPFLETLRQLEKQSFFPFY